MSDIRARFVWAAGLITYLASLLLLMIAPVVVPFVGGVILLLGTVTSSNRRDTPVIYVAVAELALASLLAILSPSRPDWLESSALPSYFLLVCVPIGVIVFRLFRPEASGFSNLQ